jgi:putative spermidine/putrescine transport system permease protein
MTPLSTAVIAPAALRRRRRGRVEGILIAPALLLFGGFFVLPLAVVLLTSLLTGNPMGGRAVGFTLRHYQRLTGDGYYLEVLWTTLRLGLWTTAAALLIGYPLAHQLARLRTPLWRTLLLMAVLSPMLIGIVVRTYAWMTLLSNQGIVNTALQGLGLTDKPIALMYNEFGTVVALVHIYVPFMVLTLTGVIGRIDPRLEEAARSLGADKLRGFLEVTLPLSLPGIVAGCLLVFALSISAYVTPILMGGFEIITLPILIYQQISGSSFNLGFAGALAMVLLAVSLLLVALYGRVMAGMAGGRAWR